MASKVTPLYAETRILLNLWALKETPVAKGHFVPSGKAYDSALEELVDDSSLARTPKPKRKSTNVYSLTNSGKEKLAKSLADEAFVFSASIGPKTTNALLRWIRTASLPMPSEQINPEAAQNHQNGSNGNSSNNGSNGKAAQISSYEEFTETALKTYDQLNQDYNLDDLVPIYRIRREMGDRIPRQQFNEWLLEIQAHDLVQLMGSNLSNVTADQ
ncbi:MAG: hypothetical protein WA949_07820, partial [Phormidesmis sp.]